MARGDDSPDDYVFQVRDNTQRYVQDLLHENERLREVNASVERELRSQYLLAYLSDASKDSEEFRLVQVKVKGRLKARTISGYYP